jgi:hypothetical protein
MPMCAFGRAPMENVMAKVEVRDHAMWIKHIHGDVALADRLLAMSAGSLIALNVDGVSGHWRKMDDGKDGRATPGLRAIGPAREHWHAIQDRRGSLVDRVEE